MGGSCSALQHHNGTTVLCSSHLHGPTVCAQLRWSHHVPRAVAPELCAHPGWGAGMHCPEAAMVHSSVLRCRNRPSEGRAPVLGPRLRHRLHRPNDREGKRPVKIGGPSNASRRCPQWTTHHRSSCPEESVQTAARIDGGCLQSFHMRSCLLGFGGQVRSDGFGVTFFVWPGPIQLAEGRFAKPGTQGDTEFFASRLRDRWCPRNKRTQQL